MTELTGRLEFFSETGTEGGAWSFFDTRFQHGTDVECGDPYCPTKSRELEGKPGHYGYGPDATGKRSSEFHASYYGLHQLVDGDKLTVLDKETGEELWSGVVALPPRQDPYAEGAYAAGGIMAAHNRPPAGVDMEQWEEWFFGEYPALLETSARFPQVSPDKLWQYGEREAARKVFEAVETVDVATAVREARDRGEFDGEARDGSASGDRSGEPEV